VDPSGRGIRMKLVEQFTDILKFFFIQTDGQFNWNAVSIIGSVVSSLLVVLTLIEMRVQRRHSYKPVVSLPDQTFYLQTNGYGIPASIKNDLGIVDDLVIHMIRVEVGNVGLATARNLEFFWKIDFDKLAEIVHQIDYDHGRYARRKVIHV